jgi:hypothetical protein
MQSSPMYVFTDAPPKPVFEYTRENAIKEALNYKMPINFFFTNPSSECIGKQTPPEKNLDFNEIVKKTGGLSLFFQNTTTMSKVETLVKSDLDGSTVVASGGRSSVRRRRDIPSLWIRASNDVPFPVDESMDSIIVSITAKSNYEHGVQLIDASGKNIPHTLVMQFGKLWLVDNPQKGQWRLTVASDVDGFSYQVNM